MPSSRPRFRNRLAWVPLALAVFACGPPNDPLPDAMIGIWRNPAPGYEENTFEVRRHAIVIGIDQYQSVFHPILSVEEVTEDGDREFRIVYATEGGGESPMTVAFVAGTPPRLRIGARPDQWVREDQAPLLREDAR